jgi:hypothetical protein
MLIFEFPEIFEISEACFVGLEEGA